MQRLILLLILATLTVAAQSRTPLSSDHGFGNLPIQRVGANDLVAISVYDAPEFTRTVRVSPDGYVRLPMLGRRIQAEGLMPSELESAIAEALKEEKLIVDPFVTVNVAEYSSRPISVMGSVRKPITFQAASPITLLDALARAEGLSADAGPDILLTRRSDANALVRRIPVKALIDAADPESNIVLTGGEEVRVPEAGKIFVVGNVKKPGAFLVTETADATVMKALAMAEGIMPYAGKQAFIYRREGAAGSKQEIVIELKDILQRKSPDVILMANDILYVPDNTGRRSSMAVLEKILTFGAGASTALIYGAVR